MNKKNDKSHSRNTRSKTIIFKTVIYVMVGESSKKHTKVKLSMRPRFCNISSKLKRGRRVCGRSSQKWCSVHHGPIVYAIYQKQPLLKAHSVASIPLGPLRIFSRIRGVIRKSRCSTGIRHRHLELRISPRIFEEIRNGPICILRGLRETDSWKKTKSQKSRGTVPLKLEE
jgi:hypothetical protein